MVLFGGNARSSPAGDFGNLNDTWTYDTGTATWTLMNPPIRPLERSDHGMAYEAKSHRIVLFGGSGRPVGGIPHTSANAETWIYDLVNDTWSLMEPPVSPPQRRGHAMAYDAESDRVILFGGARNGLPEGGTWAYDLDANAWRQMSPSPSPEGRRGAAMTYDAKADRILLVGGYSGDTYLADTWAYDFNTNRWENRAPGSPPPGRSQAATAYDVGSARTILFGGQARDEDGLVLLNDTWAYDFTNNTWEPVDGGPTPSPRCCLAAAYDTETNLVVAFGGKAVDSVVTDETWAFQYVPPPQVPLPQEYGTELFVISVAAVGLAVLVIVLLRAQRTRRGP